MFSPGPRRAAVKPPERCGEVVVLYLIEISRQMLSLSVCSCQSDDWPSLQTATPPRSSRVLCSCQDDGPATRLDLLHQLQRETGGCPDFSQIAVGVDGGAGATRRDCNDPAGGARYARCGSGSGPGLCATSSTLPRHSSPSSPGSPGPSATSPAGVSRPTAEVDLTGPTFAGSPFHMCVRARAWR